MMDNPSTANTLGRVTGLVTDSFVDFGAGVTGVRSMNAAQASWKAGTTAHRCCKGCRGSAKPG